MGGRGSVAGTGSLGFRSEEPYDLPSASWRPRKAGGVMQSASERLGPRAAQTYRGRGGGRGPAAASSPARSPGCCREPAWCDLPSSVFWVTCLLWKHPHSYTQRSALQFPGVPEARNRPTRQPGQTSSDQYFTIPGMK